MQDGSANQDKNSSLVVKSFLENNPLFEDCVNAAIDKGDAQLVQFFFGL